MSTEDKKREQRILRCIDDGLGILGDNTKKVIYYNLGKIGIEKNEIPEKPQTFCNGLIQIFGEAGADMIEKCIVEELQANFELKPQLDIGFAKAVNLIKIKPTGRPHRSKRARKTRNRRKAE